MVSVCQMGEKELYESYSIPFRNSRLVNEIGAYKNEHSIYLKQYHFISFFSSL